MKSSSALFLQGVIVLIGLAVLACLLWEPHLEGRNAHATTFEIYAKDPFLAWVYLGSTPFFVALHRAFRLLGEVREKGAFSQATVSALRTITHCAFAIIGFVAVGVAIILSAGDSEDRPAGIFMSFLVVVAATMIATTATIFARKLQQALRSVAGSPGLSAR